MGNTYRMVQLPRKDTWDGSAVVYAGTRRAGTARVVRRNAKNGELQGLSRRWRAARAHRHRRPRRIRAALPALFAFGIRPGAASPRRPRPRRGCRPGDIRVHLAGRSHLQTRTRTRRALALRGRPERDHRPQPRAQRARRRGARRGNARGRAGRPRGGVVDAVARPPRARRAHRAGARGDRARLLERPVTERSGGFARNPARYGKNTDAKSSPAAACSRYSRESSNESWRFRRIHRRRASIPPSMQRLRRGGPRASARRRPAAQSSPRRSLTLGVRRDRRRGGPVSFEHEPQSAVSQRSCSPRPSLLPPSAATWSATAAARPRSRPSASSQCRGKTPSRPSRSARTTATATGRSSCLSTVSRSWAGSSTTS